MLSAASTLLDQGVTQVFACVTHGVLSGQAITSVGASPLKELVITDTIPVGEEKRNGNITVLSVAPLLGEAIRRIHEGLSVGEMFE